MGGIEKDRETILTELENLCRKTGHAHDIINLQHAASGTIGSVDAVSLCSITDVALHLNLSMFASLDIKTMKQYEDISKVRTQRYSQSAFPKICRNPQKMLISVLKINISIQQWNNHNLSHSNKRQTIP